MKNILFMYRPDLCVNGFRVESWGLGVKGSGAEVVEMDTILAMRHPDLYAMGLGLRVKGLGLRVWANWNE